MGPTFVLCTPKYTEGAKVQGKVHSTGILKQDTIDMVLAGGSHCGLSSCCGSTDDATASKK
jgi:hypothetical protein